MSTSRDAAERIEAVDGGAFRRWLEAHHDRAAGVWLVYHKRASGRPSIAWSEAVDEALCFGWIDSQVRPIDDLRYEQWFAPRKPRGVWSRINKEKVERLTREGRMTPAGTAAIERARANGSWSTIDEAEALTEPDELAAALAAQPAARSTFDGWSPSFRRAMLHRVATAKQPETRARRIAAIVEAAAAGRKPA